MNMQTDVDQQRAIVHAMWATVAGSWATHAEFVDDRGRELTDAMLDLVALRPGQRVLELGCGPGGLGLAAAQRIAPSGEIVLSDVAPEMTAIAARRASTMGLTNVATAVLDLEAIDEPAASFDVVLSRDGVQFASDPARAAGEIRRVLRPGGRWVVATWASRARNPWLAIVLDAVSAQLGTPMPPPGVPGPFSLDDADVLLALCSDADLVDVVVSAMCVPLRALSFDDWWTRTTALAGPLATVLAALPSEQLQAIRATAGTAAAHYETSSGFEFPGVALIATGRR